MDRTELAKLWDEAQNTGLWCAPWSKAFADLSAADAAWKPAPQRHSIWQMVHHVVFWREVAVARSAGGPRPPEDETERRNFEEPAGASEAAWRAAQERFAGSHSQVRETILSPAHSLDVLKYVLPHDQYHLGQVMLVRALLGKAPIE